MLTTVITDGRGEYLERTVTAAEEMIPNFSPIIIDDSGDPAYGAWLVTRWPKIIVAHHPERRGIAGAVRTAWTMAIAFQTRFAFHLEEDFLLTVPLELDAMIRTMQADPTLAQLVLKRQPWSAEEIAAGGQMDVKPEAYEQRDDYVARIDDDPLYSFNPHLARTEAWVTAMADADSDGLERGVTNTLVAAGYHFGYWGRREDPPRCEHIGYFRSPGYRW